MKNMKNMFYAALVAVVTFPGFALAQWAPATAPTGAGSLPKGSIFNIISKIMNWLLALLGVFAIIGFVIAGILYLTAAGDEAQQKKAKAQMTWSIMGVLVALAGWVVVTAVQAMLGGANARF
ncbi:MAG: hypothetical protein KA054_03165 [Candidatus Moranbacteria bacterium]|nr:hypothetical protein [Candidatus Moranbacteria bacterium]